MWDLSQVPLISSGTVKSETHTHYQFFFFLSTQRAEKKNLKSLGGSCTNNQILVQQSPCWVIVFWKGDGHWLRALIGCQSEEFFWSCSFDKSLMASGRPAAIHTGQMSASFCPIFIPCVYKAYLSQHKCANLLMYTIYFGRCFCLKSLPIFKCKCLHFYCQWLEIFNEALLYQISSSINN